MVVGSGGQRRRGLRGKKPTPKAEDRFAHPAKRKADAKKKAEQDQVKRRTQQENSPELVAGRNPVVECLRAGVPATGLHVAQGIEVDDRVTEAVREAKEHGIPVLDVPRTELDRMTGGALHQGLGLQVPPYRYAHPEDVLSAARDSGMPPLIVALDGVTDPRNLGAVVRSAAAFGAHGVVLPQRRSAGMTAVAWRTSAGAAAKLPIARATNLTRTLRDLQQEGLMVVGLDADSDISSDQLELATEPLVVVVGSEGRGLSRLVRETCDQTVSIPMAGDVESLNASVAAGVVLAEVARRRRV
nr:23S rRNA (guanosine(2251)-2'-O)-methyltransferase RlmB [Saccharopolyspora sp. HNM0983]